MPPRTSAAAARSRVVLHALPGTKRALEVCNLVERLCNKGRKLAVWFSDEGRAEVLNQYLWTFSQSSFVPHEVWREGGEVEAPVLLVVGSVAALPAEFDTVVVADRAEDLASFRRFAEVHDLIAKGAEDEGRRESWEAAGFEVQDARATPRRDV